MKVNEIEFNEDGTPATREKFVNVLRKMAHLIELTGYDIGVAKAMNELAIVVSEAAEDEGFITTTQVLVSLGWWASAIQQTREDGTAQLNHMPEKLLIANLLTLARILPADVYDTIELMALAFEEWCNERGVVRGPHPVED
jgi:hypothetical protein